MPQGKPALVRNAWTLKEAGRLQHPAGMFGYEGLADQYYVVKKI